MTRTLKGRARLGVAILLAGVPLCAFYFVLDLPQHEANAILWSFLVGVIAGLVGPRLWRWAND